jgi:hypothetical protein
MHRRQAAGVSADHGLHHIERFPAADFAHDDAVRPHPQRRLEQLPNRQLSAPCRIFLLRLEIQRVRLGELQLRTVFNDHQAFHGRDAGRNRIQKRGLARPGAPGNQNVFTKFDADAQKLRRRT